MLKQSLKATAFLTILLIASWSYAQTNAPLIDRTVTGSGTQNYVTKWTSTLNSTIGNSQIYDDGTYVGIGTSSPSAKLHVSSGYTQYLFNDNYLKIRRAIPTFDVGLELNNNGSNSYFLKYDVANSAFLINYNQLNLFKLTASSIDYFIDNSSMQFSSGGLRLIYNNNLFFTFNYATQSLDIGLNMPSQFNINLNGTLNATTGIFNGAVEAHYVNVSGKVDANEVEVGGKIYCQEVEVSLDAGTGPDYVFEDNYNLMSLKDVNIFIKENKHLPDVPSAIEMEENGMNMKDMQLLLLKKVEELTLYTIKLEGEIETLKAAQNHTSNQ